MTTDQIKKLQVENRKLKAAENHLRVINEFAALIASVNTVDQLVWAMAKHVIAQLDFLDCVIYLKDLDKNHLVQRAAYGPKNPEDYEIKNPILIQIGQGIVGSVAQSGEVERIPDTRLDARYICDDEVRLSELAIPILFDQNLIGVIDSEHPELDFYTQQHVDILVTLASLVAPRIVSLQDHNRSLQFKNRELSHTLEKLKLVNKELEIAKEVADEMSQTKTEFIYKMSHELRTPLNAILGYGFLIREDLVEELPGSPMIEDLDRVNYSAKHLLQIINDILDVAKIEAKETSIDIQADNIEQIVQDVRIQIQHLIEQDRVQYVVKNDSAIHFVITDSQKVRQIIINLLSNAFKFTGSGKVSFSISSVINGDRPFIEFEIADTGVGISPEFLGNIFTPFEQEDNSLARRYRGTGLGLTISKQYAQLLGGDIKVESHLGRGSKFTFSVPAIYEAA